jgi:hypothetical protein
MRATFKGVVFEVNTADDFKLLVNCIDKVGEDELGEKIVEFMDKASKKNKRGLYKGKSNKNKQWSSEDDAFLMANLDKKRGKLAKALGRTKHAVSVRTSILKSKMKSGSVKGMNKTQVDVLGQVKLGVKPQDISITLGISLQSVYNAMYILRKGGYLAKGKRTKKVVSKEIRRVPFSDKELQFLKDNHDKLPYVTLAEQLDRPYSSIVSKLEELGFKKFKGKEEEPKPKPKVPAKMPKAVKEAKRQAKKLNFDALSRNPELQPLAADLVVACAKSKVPLKLSELVTVLSITEGEAKVLLVDIFNSQKRIFEVIDRPNGRIIWKGDVLIFR